MPFRLQGHLGFSFPCGSVELASISVTCERQLIRTRSVGIMAGTTRRNLDNTWGNRKRNESSAHISPRTRNWLSAKRRRKAIKQRKESLTPGHKLPRHLKSHRSCLFFIEWHFCKRENFLVPMNSAILLNESCSGRTRKKFLQRAFDGILDRDALETLFAFRKKRENVKVVARLGQTTANETLLRIDDAKTFPLVIQLRGKTQKAL